MATAAETKACRACGKVNLKSAPKCLECDRPFSPEAAAAPSEEPVQEGARTDDRQDVSGKEAPASTFVLVSPGNFELSCSEAILLGRKCQATPAEVAEVLDVMGGISRRHCLIAMNGDVLSVHDLASRNGTTLNGKAIQAGSSLSISLDDLPAKLNLGRYAEFYLEPVR
jgi:hypothetical protein